MQVADMKKRLASLRWALCAFGSGLLTPVAELAATGCIVSLCCGRVNTHSAKVSRVLTGAASGDR